MEASEVDELVYMVTGVDENGDTHIFVTGDLQRAEARHQGLKAQLVSVKANWRDAFANDSATVPH